MAAKWVVDLSVAVLFILDAVLGLCFDGSADVFEIVLKLLVRLVYESGLLFHLTKDWFVLLEKFVNSVVLIQG